MQIKTAITEEDLFNVRRNSDKSSKGLVDYGHKYEVRRMYQKEVMAFY